MLFWALHHNLAFVFAYPILPPGLVPASGLLPVIVSFMSHMGVYMV
jgi:hypothetical protein